MPKQRLYIQILSAYPFSCPLHFLSNHSKKKTSFVALLLLSIRGAFSFPKICVPLSKGNNQLQRYDKKAFYSLTFQERSALMSGDNRCGKDCRLAQTFCRILGSEPTCISSVQQLHSLTVP